MVNLRGEVLWRGCCLEEKRRLDNLIPMPLRGMTDAETLAWRLRETIEYYAQVAEGAQGVRSGKPLQNRAQTKRRSQSKMEFPSQAPGVTKKMPEVAMRSTQVEKSREKKRRESRFMRA